jgi:hypothetical protein
LGLQRSKAGILVVTHDDDNVGFVELGHCGGNSEGCQSTKEEFHHYTELVPTLLSKRDRGLMVSSEDEDITVKQGYDNPYITSTINYLYTMHCNLCQSRPLRINPCFRYCLTNIDTGYRLKLLALFPQFMTSR